jgi:hypothetical protein
MEAEVRKAAFSFQPSAFSYILPISKDLYIAQVEVKEFKNGR